MVILDFFVGMAAGLLSGFGIGGGTLLILWLTLAADFDQLHAGGMNLLFYPSAALPALKSHIKNQLVEKKVVLLCIVAGIPSCILASLIANVVDVTLLRRGFGLLLLYVGLKEIFAKDASAKDS